jgi:hypothetical protein
MNGKVKMEATTIIVMPKQDAELLIQIIELVPTARGTRSHAVIEATILRLREALKGPVNVGQNTNTEAVP